MHLSCPCWVQTAMLSLFSLSDHHRITKKTGSSPSTHNHSSLFHLETTQCNPHILTESTRLAQLVYHKPPNGVEYSQNPSVFGRILEGTLPSIPYVESTELYAFQDIRPRAQLHALVIPKIFITSVKCLLSTCSCCSHTNRKFFKEETKTIMDIDSIDRRLSLLLDMKNMALSILEKEQPQVLQKRDYILCFHVPPYNSVDHLHLHVLAPASQMNFAYRYCK